MATTGLGISLTAWEKTISSTGGSENVSSPLLKEFLWAAHLSPIDKPLKAVIKFQGLEISNLELEMSILELRFISDACVLLLQMLLATNE
jgi:hypothetical protein